MRGSLLGRLSLRTRLLGLLLVPLLGTVVFAGLWASTRLAALNDAEGSLERTEAIVDVSDLLVAAQVHGRLSATRAQPSLFGAAAPGLLDQAREAGEIVDARLDAVRASQSRLAELADVDEAQIERELDTLVGLREQLDRDVLIDDAGTSRRAIDSTFAEYRDWAERVERLVQKGASPGVERLEVPSLVTLGTLHRSVVEEAEVLVLAYLDRERLDAETAARLQGAARVEDRLLETVSALGLPETMAGVERFRSSSATRTWAELRGNVVRGALAPDGGEPPDASGFVQGAVAASARANAVQDLRSEVASAALAQADRAAGSARSEFIVAVVIAVAIAVGTLVLGLLAIRPISYRLGALATRAHEIGRGNLDVSPIAETGTDEIAVLSQSFDEMSATLSGVSRKTDALAEGRADDAALAEELPGHIGRSLQGSVTRLRQMTARLRAGEALARSVVENAAEAIWLLDEDARVRWANEAAARLLDRTADEQVGMSLEHIVQLPRAWHNGGLPELSSHETQALSRDGSEIPVLLSSRRVVGEHGETLATVLARDISERKRLELELRHAARHDGLTGLPNRASFEARLAECSAQAEITGAGFGLLFIDLDRFKAVNDVLGHRVGDYLLTAAADRLDAATREGDVLARLGGDEFVVLVQDVSDPDDLEAQAGRLLAVFDAPFEIEGERVHMTASIGVAMGDDVAADPSQLLRDADIAMYRAKGTGGGRLARFSRRMGQRADERSSLEQALRGALRSGEVTAAYQPIVGIADGRIFGAELLARWSPDGEPVPPAVFIPVAEATGLVADIGELLLHEACARLGEWRQDPELAELRLAVNVSGRQLTRGNLGEEVEAALAAAGAPPSRLSLELTESYLLADPKWARTPIERVRELGVGVAIDDFGTGSASLNYMRELPVDMVKIDRSFLSRVDSEPVDRMIVQMVAAVSHAAGLRVVAEGIETEAQLDAATESGCDLVQGYYFARPMAFDHFVRWMHLRSGASSAPSEPGAHHSGAAT